IPNSEVKPFSADDSVAVCHAKVGNCQALKLKTQALTLGFFFDYGLGGIVLVDIDRLFSTQSCQSNLFFNIKKRKLMKLAYFQLSPSRNVRFFMPAKNNFHRHLRFINITPHPANCPLKYLVTQNLVLN
ncbi:MAG: hypothetical protein M0Q44_22285, partial [Methylobacter sp.]|nr:hypothetical protein [Methylobacter sp.]